jgi:uncharacterized protein (TIGR03435 family)
MRALSFVTVIGLICGIAFAQSPDALPKFDIADVHASPKTQNPFARNTPARNGRYEIKTATMLDLIRIAYTFDADKILGGPNWLEMNRYDVTAKVPEDSTPDTQKQMLQQLLQERFKLVVHKETKPLPTYALIQGKKLLMKEAEGTEEAGCKPQAASSGAPTQGGIRLMTAAAGGTPITIDLGPGMMIHYICRNMTMAAFTSGIRGMFGASVGTNPVLDDTGLKGAWNFDMKWSMQLNGFPGMDTGDRITFAEAVDKQLGLKLEQRQIPTPVMVVDSVESNPSPNVSGVATALPPIPAPTEFEVADVKPSDPDARNGRFQMQPGGRLVSENMNMRFLLFRAFNANNNESIVGVPKWADSERFNITAKAASTGPLTAGIDNEALAPMIRSLLVDRFKLTYHTEERPLTAYSLVAAKPKMKKADPASRTWCKFLPTPPSSPPGTRVISCQNATMAQFAERLQGTMMEMSWPVLDATGIEGGWDFTLTFVVNMQMAMPVGAVAGRGGETAPAGNAVPTAADPTGGLTLFEAVEKQLGLKLEAQKRSLPVIVIDHLEQKPTEN